MCSYSAASHSPAPPWPLPSQAQQPPSLAEVILGSWSWEAPVTLNNDIECLTPSSINRHNGTLSAPFSSLEYIVVITQSYYAGMYYLKKRNIAVSSSWFPAVPWVMRNSPSLNKPLKAPPNLFGLFILCGQHGKSAIYLAHNLGKLAICQTAEE